MLLNCIYYFQIYYGILMEVIYAIQCYIFVRTTVFFIYNDLQ